MHDMRLLFFVLDPAYMKFPARTKTPAYREPVAWFLPPLRLYYSMIFTTSQVGIEC